MDLTKLNNFKEAMKPMVSQNLEGLLYDLNLLPEVLKTELDGKRYSAIVNLYELVDTLKCCTNCGNHSEDSMGNKKCKEMHLCVRYSGYSGSKDKWKQETV